MEKINQEETNEKTLQKRFDYFMQSINRASRLQRGLLPDMKALSSWLREVFVMYSPKDVVCGDLYWWKRIDNKIFIAVGDCTGHGIPGAFMSIVAFSKLKMIVDSAELNTMEILYRMNQEIISILNQEKGDSQDSVDMALCRIDLDERLLQFSGAYRPLIYVRNGELYTIKGDRSSVGGVNKYFEKRRSYTLHEMPIEDGDMFYLCSDGFSDQFGVMESKKYGSKQFKNFLHLIHPLPVEKQKNALLDELETWKGDIVQTDDITVLGFRLFFHNL
ncbi:MAG: PP2C family protein-serine/threonine phosphatase [Thermonemataceae bacterium]